MPITTLFLDAGGVLVVPNWERVSRTLADHGVKVEPRRLEAADPYVRHDIDTGESRHASDQQRGWLYFDLVLRHAGIEASDATAAALADLEAYHAKENLWERVPDGVFETLERFRALGLRLVVVSNANGKLRHLFARVGLERYLDVALDSFEERVEKPDPRLFRLALERSGAMPETTMHVGDLYHVDVEGARAAGIRPMLLDPLDLYTAFDCERVRSLGEVADRLAAERG